MVQTESTRHRHVVHPREFARMSQHCPELESPTRRQASPATSRSRRKQKTTKAAKAVRAVSKHRPLSACGYKAQDFAWIATQEEAIPLVLGGSPQSDKQIDIDAARSRLMDNVVRGYFLFHPNTTSAHPPSCATGWPSTHCLAVWKRK
jgi:hypothetical protein